MNHRVVVESPLSGDFVRNYRYLLWCLRALRMKLGIDGIASHLINPWFMDDAVAGERAAGIDNSWVWQPDIPHWFFLDFGFSRGMLAARERCEREQIPVLLAMLAALCPDSWAAFERGEWPPHTRGFELAHVALEDMKILEGDLRNGMVGGESAEKLR